MVEVTGSSPVLPHKPGEARTPKCGVFFGGFKDEFA